MKIRTLALPLVLAALMAGCNGQGAAWQDAQQADTVPAYQQFLDDYPDSPHAGDARQRLQALQRAQSWAQATQADTIDAYQKFLGEYSSGDEVDQARQRLAELQREKDWSELSDSNDIQALEAFADRNQGTALAEQAQQRIDELEAAARQEQARQQQEQQRAEEATHTHRVQLAAFATMERARKSESQLEQSLSGVLGDTGLDVQQSGSYYLVRTDPLTEQDAQALCKQLKQNGQDCLVVKR